MINNNKFYILNKDYLNQPIDNVILDVDETMYSYDTGIFELMNQNVNEFMQTKLGIAEAEAMKLQNHYYETFGTSSRGWLAYKMDTQYGVSVKDFADYMQNVPLDGIPPNPLLVSQIKELTDNDKKIYLFTNGTKDHAERVCDRLGVDDRDISGIMSAEQVQFIPKPNAYPFIKLFDEFDIDPKASLFVEDSHRNLATAKDVFGMKTACIVYPESKHKYLFSDYAMTPQNQSQNIAKVFGEMGFVDVAAHNINTMMTQVINTTCNHKSLNPTLEYLVADRARNLVY